MALAISRVIEKVVVVVVVITREGSLGSGPRLDWENLREARLAAASSVEKEFGKDRKNCLCVVSCRETTSVAKRSRVSFRKGRPRFVVFIMWEEEAWGEASCCMAGGGKSGEE